MKSSLLQSMTRDIIKLSLIGIFLSGTLSRAQSRFPEAGPVFNDSVVPRVDILIQQDSLDLIFNSPESNHEYPATFIFSSGSSKDTLGETGFRIRGNTSRFSAKKSFKVSFNTFHPGRKFFGLEKMNLNGEHNDPSVIRSKLCWDMLRKLEIPASRANHVELYINGEYFGLYINVEHIDEEFVQKRFGRQDGNLYKCLWPADLAYISNNPGDYRFESGERLTYDLKATTGTDAYADLAEFIFTLNNIYGYDFICEMEKLFNVDNFLKILAFDVLTGNWDDYAFLKNNYYLYHDPVNDRFEFIPYDLDNTLGIDWIGQDWSTRDVYDWAMEGEDRPLVSRLLGVQEYRDRYTFYLQSMIDEVLDTIVLFPKVDSIMDRISPYVERDPYYSQDFGYTYEDFLASYDQPLGGHVQFGLKPFITERTYSAIQMLENTDMVPVISRINLNHPRLGEAPVISAGVIDDGTGLSVETIYTINGNSYSRTMADDGLLADEIAGDGVFTAALDPVTEKTGFGFQVKATTATHTKTRPCDPLTLEVIESEDPDLVINEFMAGNLGYRTDEFGEYDDWIELYNRDPNPVWLGDKYLSDDFDEPGRWALPDYTMEPGGYLLVWADGDNQQGPFHTGFRLNKSGEEIGIFDSYSRGNMLIDSLTYGPMNDDFSIGRSTDGGSKWSVFMSPTPGYSNLAVYFTQTGETSDGIRIWPNPVSPDGRVNFSRPARARVYELSGRLVGEVLKSDGIMLPDLRPGIYLVELQDEKISTVYKLVVR